MWKEDLILELSQIAAIKYGIHESDSKYLRIAKRLFWCLLLRSRKSIRTSGVASWNHIIKTS